MKVLSLAYGFRTDSGAMKSSRRLIANVVLVVAPTAAATIGLSWMPPFVAFGCALGAAVVWCFWVERHPLR